MKRLLALAAMLSSPVLAAETPCDFKGLAVGSKVTQAEVMTTLGVTKYQKNPTRDPFKTSMELIQKYGLLSASEIEAENIGPYCVNDYCRVPVGVYVGSSKTPVNVYVGMSDGIISEIDISFGETYWDELLPVIKQKYGDPWSIEHMDMTISDKPTKQSLNLDRVIYTHKTDGTNATTNDKCQIWATNYDIIETHHDSYGLYHSILAIKLISKNF